jgi:hypothetical protein
LTEGVADVVAGDAEAFAVGAGRKGYLPAPAVETGVLLAELLGEAEAVAVASGVVVGAEVSATAAATGDVDVPAVARESGMCGAPRNLTIVNAPTDRPTSAAPIAATMTLRDDFAGRAEFTNGAAVIPGPLCAYAPGDGVVAPLIDGECGAACGR